jgi:hypothetical protein
VSGERRVLGAFLVATTFALGECFALGACCSEPDSCHRHFADGTYTDGLNVPSRTLELDRKAGTVTIRYDRGGRPVVEHWRIERLSVR